MPEVLPYQHAVTDVGRRGEDDGEKKYETPTDPQSANAVEDPFASERTPPRLANTAFHGLIGEFVDSLLPETEAGRENILIQSLVMFGNMIGRCRYWEVNHARHYTNLFAVVVAATGDGKGTGYTFSKRTFYDVDPSWSKCVQGGLTTGEGLINALRDETMGKDKHGNETCVDEGVSDKRMLATCTELSGLMTAMARQDNRLTDYLRQGWDCELQLSSMSKKAPQTATGVHLSIIGHITPEELTARISTTDIANGLWNRFLWCYTTRSKLRPEGGDVAQEVHDHFVNRFKAAKDMLTGAERRMGMTRGAQALWGTNDSPGGGAYAILRAGKPGLLGAITARGPALVRRIACIYALLDGVTDVDVPHLLAALEVFGYSMATCQFIFGDMLGSVVADDILSILRDEYPKCVTRTGLFNHFSRNRSRKEVQDALDILAATGKARMFRRTIAAIGRPTEYWFAVPRYNREPGSDG